MSNHQATERPRHSFLDSFCKTTGIQYGFAAQLLENIAHIQKPNSSKDLSMMMLIHLEIKKFYIFVFSYETICTLA